MEARSKDERTALLLTAAAAAGYVRLLDYLLACGADQSAVDNQGNGAIHLALQNVSSAS